MKKFLAIIMSAACIFVFSGHGDAAQWSLSGSGGQPASDTDIQPNPFATPLTPTEDGSVEIFSGTTLAPLVPMQLDRFVISLFDGSPGDSSPDGTNTQAPRLQLNAGVKNESSIDPKTFLMDDVIDPQNTTREPRSSVVFIGVGLDLDQLSLKGNAFMGRPMGTLAGKLTSSADSPSGKNSGLDTNAYGFEAAAGYQLNTSVALGGGVGKMTDKNEETDKTEEIYAVYAQAILAVAPGVQVKPEFGQVERVKDKSNPEEVDESFYGGAVWEINF